MILIALMSLCGALLEEDLPVTLGNTAAVRAVEPPEFALGVHLGWFEMKDAEDGELFYGIHARAYLLEILAVEASIDFAKQDFIDDDAELRTVPVQVTAMLFPFADLPVRPYLLGGAGWYYSKIDYSGTLAGLDDESDSTFGVHLGAGLELLLGRVLMLHGDVRYIFLDEPNVDNSQLDEEEFDFWQVTLGGSLAF